jgi:Asp-tRNA(Asn)/Glu-tRNA(Gln) amidotransferase A subunit family amidase
MLSAIAGEDARVPISYPVDTRTFLAAVRRPSLKGLRIAWGGDLGITPVDDEVRRVTESTLAVFRTLGARVETAHPAFDEIDEIVRTSRGFMMVAAHGEKLAQWKPVMQENLVRNIEQGLALTASEIANGERLRTNLYHRVRRFMERYDLILTPTTPVPPFPLEYRSGPPAINGVPMKHYIQWALLTYAFTVINSPAISVPAGLTKDRLPVGLQIAGRWRGEATVLRAAAAFERAQPWANVRPPGL